MKVVVFIITGVLAASVLATAQWQKVDAAEPLASTGGQVIVVRATNACFSDMVRVTGYLVPRRAAVVNVEGEGFKTIEVLVAEGDQVSSGQELVRLTRKASNDPRAPAVSGGARSTTTTLRAPVAGRVIYSGAIVGALVAPQAGPLFRIITDDEIDLEVEVPSLQIPKLKPGATARITLDGGLEYNGRVRIVEIGIEQKTQLGRARLSIDKSPSLRVGMFARATIDATRSCGVSIPRSAVTYQTEGSSVQVVLDNTIQTRRVQIGLLSDNDVEIREGIQDGDTVVANAGTSLHDGDRVKTIFAEESDQMQVR